MGNDSIDCDGGGGAVDYTGSATAVVVDLTAGTGTGEGFDSVLNCDDINGSDHGDTLNGNGNDNWIYVGNGNDTVDGLAGEDTYDAGAAETGVTVDLGAGTSTGGSGTDALSHIEDVSGSSSDDTLTGSSGDNIIYGVDGNDKMSGGAGNVDGADSFDGGGGIDTVDYGANTSTTTVHLADGVTPCAWFATGALCTTGNGVSGAIDTIRNDATENPSSARATTRSPGRSSTTPCGPMGDRTP